MNIKTLVKVATDSTKQKEFFDMQQRLMRKMIERGFDEEEIEYFENVCRSTQLMHIVSEVGEAFQGLRKDNFNEYCKEVADIGISTGTLAGMSNIDLEKEIVKKLHANSTREKLHGKKF